VKPNKALRIIQKAPTLQTGDLTAPINECDQLIAIFVKSISTAIENNKKTKKN